MANLPDHLQGRSKFGGPLVGGLVSFNCVLQDAGNDETRYAYVNVPCNMRVLRIDSIAQTVTNDPSLLIEAGANTAGLADLVAVNDLAASGVAKAHTLVSAERSLTRGDQIKLTLVSDADSVANGCSVTITGYTQDHTSDDATTD